jgi:hypothetical protein
MAWTRVCVVGFVVLAGCRFTVDSIQGGAVDLGGVDGDVLGCDSCPTSCVQTPAPHCGHLVPTGPLVPGDFSATDLTAQTVGGDIVIDTDQGGISGALSRPPGAGVFAGIRFQSRLQPGGRSVGVFTVAGLELAQGAHIRFTGSNAFALVSTGAVALHGTIDGSCSAAGPGPGGFLGGSDSGNSDGNGHGDGGGHAGSNGGGGVSGGGGGGYGDAGGRGTAAPLGTFTPGGAITGNLVAPGFMLAGGSGGGAGGSNSNGGGGGGALMFSVDGDITVDGVITVGGCGGASGDKGKGGSGGGAGGALVLEGRSVRLTALAVLAANGGGGGGGGGGTGGQPGQGSVTPALGGLAGTEGSAGGVGGARGAQAGSHFTQGGDGAALAAGKTAGGGGGGGAGRIAVRSAPSGLTDQSQSVSPDRSDRNLDNERLTDYGTATFQ